MKAKAPSAAVAAAQAVIANKSRSFSFAARLLPADVRADAVVLYAWCRRADDAVDDAPNHATAAAALVELQQELEAIYAGQTPSDPQLQAFADVVQRTKMPKAYPAELLAGMAMDLHGTRYDDPAVFLQYCYRAAGVVGLMMCHVMGVTHLAALQAACQLGMAMQMTNICRDVQEDWQRGRLYLPTPLLAQCGLLALPLRLGQPLLPAHGPMLAKVVRELLLQANERYRQGLSGLRFLPWRAAIAIGVAAAVYADIGTALARQGYDPLQGRAYTSAGRKVWLALGVVAGQLATLPRRWLAGRPGTPLIASQPATPAELLLS